MKNLFKHLATLCLTLVLLVCVLPMAAEAKPYLFNNQWHELQQIPGESEHVCVDCDSYYCYFRNNPYPCEDTGANNATQGDELCDYCGGEMPHQHKNADNNCVCDTCGEKISDRHGRMIDTTVQTAATCKATGVMNTKCENNCGYTSTRTIARDSTAHGEMVDTTVQKAATCKEPGVMNTKCEYNCGHTGTREIPMDKNAHGEMVDTTVQTAATCKAPGVMNTKCERDCGHTGTREIPVDENAHEWGDWEAKNADQHWSVCSRCKKTDKENHDFICIETVKSTSSKKGYKLYECETCKYQYKEILPRVGGISDGLDDVPKTGDNTSLGLLGLIMAGSFAGMAVMLGKKRA